jgi:hypothetical protein
MHALKARLELFLDGREARALGTLAAAAALIRLVCVAAIDIEPVGDYLNYLTMASNLADGNGLVDRFGNLALMSGGYPYFLYSLFLVAGKSLSAAKLANVALGVVSVLLLYRLGTLGFGSKAVGFVGATFWSFYAPSITYCGLLAKENLMIPMMIGLLILLTELVRGRRPMAMATAAGGLLGLLLVVAAADLMMAPVALVTIAASRQSWKGKAASLALFGLAAVVALSPWLVRTYRLFGRPLLTTSGGMNLWMGNRPGAGPMFEGIPGFVGETGMTWRELKAKFGEEPADRIAKSEAIAYMKSHPRETLTLMARKFVAFWYPPVHRAEAEESKAALLARKVWLAQYVLIGVLALIGLAASRRDFAGSWPILLTIALYVIVHMLIYVTFRYRLAIEPLVDLLAARGALLMLDAIRSRAPEPSMDEAAVS